MARGRLVTRSFALATAATFAYFVAVGMSIALLSRFIEEELGGNGFHIGLATACFAGVAIIARPSIARVSGRIGLGPAMVLGSAIGTVCLLLTGFVGSVWLLLPLRAVNGVAEATIFVGGLAIISRQAPPHRQAEAASFYSVAVFGGLTVGPLLGEAVLGDDRFAAAFCVAGACSAVCGVIAMSLPRSIGRAEGAGARGPLVHRAAVGPGAVLAFGIAAMTGFIAFVPTRATDLGMAGAAPIFALYGILCLAVRIFAARLPDRMGATRTTAASLSALAVGLAVAAVLDSPLGLYLGATGVALGLSLLYPALMAVTVASVADAERTAALATFSAFFELGSMTGGLVLGGVVALTDERGAFAGGAALALVGLLVVRPIALVRATRPRPAPGDVATSAAYCEPT